MQIEGLGEGECEIVMVDLYDKIILEAGIPMLSVRD